MSLLFHLKSLMSFINPVWPQCGSTVYRPYSLFLCYVALVSLQSVYHVVCTERPYAMRLYDKLPHCHNQMLWAIFPKCTYQLCIHCNIQNLLMSSLTELLLSLPDIVRGRSCRVAPFCNSVEAHMAETVVILVHMWHNNGLVPMLMPIFSKFWKQNHIIVMKYKSCR